MSSSASDETLIEKIKNLEAKVKELRSTLNRERFAEDSTHDSLNNLSGIFNQTFVGIAQTDLNGKFLLVNDRYCEIVGRSKEELYETTLFDITLPEDLEVNKPLLEQMIHKDIPFTFDKRYKKPDSSLVWVSINVSSIKDPEGRPMFILGVCQDISEKKRAEEALVESEERFRMMAEASGILIAHTDNAGNAVYFNSEWMNLTGRSMVELINFGWADIFHPEDRIPFVEAYMSVFEKREVLKREFRLLSHKGEYRWMIAVVSPRFGLNGNFEGYISSCIDITERKQTEEALKESESRFRAMADTLPLAIWLADINGKAEFLNRWWLEYCGIPYEPTQTTAAEIAAACIHPEDAPKVMAAFMQAIQTGKGFKVEQRNRAANGEYRWFLNQGEPYYHSQTGKIIGWFGAGTDIHDRKLAEASIADKNKELTKINNDLDNFIYTASHDLKAPMSNIEGLLLSLRSHMESQKDKMDEDTDILLQLMEKSINRFKTTILDLTEITKVQKPEDEDVNEINLSQIIEDVKLSIYDKIAESHVTIETDFSQGNSLKFSRKNLKSIIYNLISNAIKYRDHSRTPEIFIRTEKKDYWLILSIKDNGLGISIENQSKIFGMFKRAHDHVEGTGIGLYIVKRIIDNAGGKIEVESEVGKGSTFRIYFRMDG